MDPPPVIAAIRAIVHDALAPFADGAATVDVGWRDGWDAWVIEVTPADPDAAEVHIGLDRYGSLGIVVANTWTELPLFDDSLEQIRLIIGSVFRGQVAEIGRRSAAFVRVGSGKESVSFGAAHLPLPWSLRRVRRFSAYGGAARC